MLTIRSALSRFLRSEDGPTAVEYAIMLALIFVVCISAVVTLGTEASASFGATDAAIEAAEAGSTGS